MWRRTALLCLLLATPALGLSVSLAPRPSLWLTTGEFLALDAQDSLTLYDQKGTTIRRFAGVGNFVQAIAATSDERFLLLAGYDGRLSLFDLRTGAQLWTKTPKDTALGWIHDASFAWDGRSLVVCNDRGEAIIYDTATGKQIGAINVPSTEPRIMSAALSPDGSTGVLVDLSEHVFQFDTATGKATHTGLKGGWPIRYSADGRYFAFPSSNFGGGAQLRIATADAKSSLDAGGFCYIGHIKPTPDGKFLLSAMAAGGGKSNPGLIVGAVCDPQKAKVAVVWNVPLQGDVQPVTDFDPQTMLGVCTDYRLVTLVLDLKKSKTLLTIDHSDAWQRQLHFEQSAGPDLIVAVIVAVAGAVVVVLVIRRLRIRRAEAWTRLPWAREPRWR